MADLLTTEPKAGDSKNNLLFKWVEEVCGPGVAKIADSDNILLSKILRCTIANGSGGPGGGGVDTNYILTEASDPILSEGSDFLVTEI